MIDARPSRRTAANGAIPRSPPSILPLLSRATPRTTRPSHHHPPCSPPITFMHTRPQPPSHAVCPPPLPPSCGGWVAASYARGGVRSLLFISPNAHTPTTPHTRLLSTVLPFSSLCEAADLSCAPTLLTLSHPYHTTARTHTPIAFCSAHNTWFLWILAHHAYINHTVIPTNHHCVCCAAAQDKKEDKRGGQRCCALKAASLERAQRAQHEQRREQSAEPNIIGSLTPDAAH